MSVINVFHVSNGTEKVCTERGENRRCKKDPKLLERKMHWAGFTGGQTLRPNMYLQYS